MPAYTYNLLPAPQKFLSTDEIRNKYTKRGVLAHSCVVEGTDIKGGCVFAVALEPGVGYDELKELQIKMKKSQPNRKPICYLCLSKKEPVRSENIEAEPESDTKLKPITLHNDPVLDALMGLPDDVLADALKTISINE